MTMPALPNVQLGNVASDIGSGANTFVQGLIGQRQRQAQLAMQQAIAAGRTQLEGAQTQDVQQQVEQRAHENAPSGHDQYLQLKYFMPEATPEHLTGMSRAEADKFINVVAQRHMANLLANQRIQDSEESRLRTSYDREQTHSVKGLDAYRNTLQQYTQSKDTNPYQAEGMLLSWLRQNTNRMNQAEISRISRLGGLEQQYQRWVGGYVMGNNPVDQPMLQALRDAAAGVGKSMYTEYHTNRDRYIHLSQARGIAPEFVVTGDNYDDILQLEQTAGLRPQAAGPQVADPAAGYLK